ncbi:ABC transporter permease [Amycolatopsis acidiphila]|uniref:ABC transporter permease n=1 Tax=Amycolatopsis acidiphila TaxID=715473 RepID=A0A558A8C8_9PSEU|nr:ABC transporter permease [Amycolatopsis acidiphila]TVT20513.1 ABC transporter permease [Amycolatopsis acidiphila]UIJ57038.1 ABC transporter permease [Amycolatopsis acidiphila]GHG53714.1 ABC transporter permease [Amycolatopsis acidiphila]
MTSVIEPKTTGVVATPRGTSKATRRLSRPRTVPFARLLGVLVLLGLWSLASALGALDPRKLSAPWTVVRTGADLIADGTLQANLGASLYRVGLGFGIGVLAGTALALLAGLSRVGEALIDGPVQVKRAIPLLGLAPLMILWLGIGQQFKIVLIAVGVVVYSYVQTHAALIAIDHRYVELAESLGLSRLRFVRKVVIPGALPGFFLGLRLSASIAWLTLVVVESVNAVDGLGKMMFRAQDYGQSDVILVGLAVFGIFGFGSDALLRILERKVLSWRRTLAG